MNRGQKCKPKDDIYIKYDAQLTVEGSFKIIIYYITPSVLLYHMTNIWYAINSSLTVVNDGKEQLI